MLISFITAKQFQLSHLQRRTVLLPDFDARSLPSDEKETELTRNLWPRSAWEGRSDSGL